MDVVFKSLTLRRFRSVVAERIDLNNPLFLVGRNGSGKSNIADAFAFLADAMASPLSAVFDARGGIATVRNRTSVQSHPPNLGLRIELGRLGKKADGGFYAFEIKAQKDHGFRVKREKCVVRMAGGEELYFDRNEEGALETNTGLAPQLSPVSLCLPIIGGDRRFAPVLEALSAMRVYSIEPQKVRSFQDPESGVTLRPDGRNAASVLEDIRRTAPETAEKIGALLETVVPHTTHVKAVRHANKLALEFTQEWAKKKKLSFAAFSMSDGTLRALGILLAVFQEPAPSLIVVEEPEATIHPGALGALLDVIRAASKRMHVVITTHSPDLLDAANGITDFNLRVVAWRDGATRVTPPSGAVREALKDHLMGAGELLRSNVLREPDLFDEVSPQQLELF